MLSGMSREEAEKAGLLKQLKGYAPKAHSYGAIPQVDPDENTLNDLTHNLAMLHHANPSRFTAHLAAPTAAQAEGLMAINTANALYGAEITLKRKQMALRELQTRKHKHPILWKLFGNTGEETRLAQLPNEIDRLDEQLKSATYQDKFTCIQEHYQKNSAGFVARALKVLNHLNIVLNGSDEKLREEDLNAPACKLPDDINIAALIDLETDGISDTYLKQRIAILYLRQMIVLHEAQMELNQGKKSLQAEDLNQLQQYKTQLNRLKAKMLPAEDENLFLDLAEPKAPTQKL